MELHSKGNDSGWNQRDASCVNCKQCTHCVTGRFLVWIECLQFPHGFDSKRCRRVADTEDICAHVGKNMHPWQGDPPEQMDRENERLAVRPWIRPESDRPARQFSSNQTKVR